jgi:hypothetical protein
MSGPVSGWLGSTVLHCALLVLIMLFVQRPFGPAAGGAGGGDGNGAWIDASFGFGAESANEETSGDSEITPVSFELPPARHEPVDPDDAADSFAQALHTSFDQLPVRLAHSAAFSGAAAREGARNGSQGSDFGPDDSTGSGGNVGGSAGAGTGPDLGSGNGRGGTSLFGIEDAGARYVYVIDRSISMQDCSALDAAKSELAVSLSRINPTEEFQVIFFNHRSQALVPRKAAEAFFRGTEPHRRLAVAQMQLIPPEGATLPLPALSEALNLRPDVVFFLTDGEEPGLSPGEVHRLGERNAGRARIHCIRFVNSDAEPSASGNWMQQLAAQNAGQYVVRDLRPPANSN